MIKFGKLIECDCCHKEVFLPKKEGKDTVLDGGYTHIENYAPAIDWTYSSDVHMDLCPSCTTKINEARQKVIDTVMDHSVYSIQVNT